ncbi:MAG: CBS domain-containing protein [Nitrospirota bacterium]|nr:CBS domain-containing protein [Nitrospirota bacterium]
MTTQGKIMLRPLAVMMSRSLRSIPPDASLLDAARLMRDSKIGALLVEDREQFVGVVSETDLVRKAMAGGKDPLDQPVKSVMSSPIITIEIDRSAHDASDQMAEHGIRHLAVTQDGEIVGMISVVDLLRYFKNWGTL